MKVMDVMSKQPHFLSPDEFVINAAKEMQKLDCGIIPVGDGERLLGMVTDRDITIRAVAQAKDPNKTKLKDIMTPDVWYCYEDDKLEDAAKSMEAKQVRRLVVLNQDKKLTGIVSLGDICVKGHNDKLSGEIIEKISEK